MRMIKEFKVPNFDEYNFSEVSVGAPVFLNHVYELQNICGRVVHISERRKIINIEFTKIHPLHKVLKEADVNLKLDLVHLNTFAIPSKLVQDFVVYLGHGED